MEALAQQQIAARVMSSHGASTRAARCPPPRSAILPLSFAHSRKARMTRSIRTQARRGGRDDDWQLRDEWQDFPQSKDSSSGSSRGSQRFDPFGSQSDQSAYWEQRAAQIQQAAQMKARRAAERFGVQDVRVEPVQSKDIGRFVVPALGVTAAVILAGPMIGFMAGMGALIVGGTLFSGSLLFALTFALPLLVGAGAVGMMSFWAFGLASVAFSLALPVLFAGAAFSAFRMLARGGKGFATSRASAQQPITAAEAAAAEAQAQHRQEEEEKRRLEAELREFDSRLERSERSKNTTY